MAGKYILAIDLGSTWCKAAFIDRTGQFVSTGRAYVRDGLPFGHGPDELDDLWMSVVEAVGEARGVLAPDSDDDEPAVIVVTTRKAPGIWLDADHQPIALNRDAILNAGRGYIEDCYRSDIWQKPGPFGYGYGIDLIGNTRWLWREHPELHANVRFVGNLHNWLIYRLTGQWLTSHAGGPVQNHWPHEVAQLCGLPGSAFPGVVPDTGQIGLIARQAAFDLGLPETTQVACGTHDGAAANIGAGVIHPADACLTLGTNGVLRVVTGQRLAGEFGYTITADQWALVRDLPDLALFLDQVVAILENSRASQVDPTLHRVLAEQAEKARPGSNGLRLAFASPTIASDVSGAVAAGFNSAQIYRAALEGAAFGFLQLVQRASSVGANPKRFAATGGATENLCLMTILAGFLGKPITLANEEAGLLGAARIGSIGADWYASITDAIQHMRNRVNIATATEAEVAEYHRLAATFRPVHGTAPGDASQGF